MPERTEGRCSDRSRSAGEPIAATAVTADRWLLLEVPGSWPRDVSSGDGLPAGRRAAVERWAAGPGVRRVLFVRRPGGGLRERLAYVVLAEEGATEVRRVEVPDGDDVDFDVAGQAADLRLVLVCGHGSRDTCCARRGTSVYRKLAETVEADELWISSHQGGHRFAANVLLLPSGIQLGRLDPEDAVTAVVDGHAGRILLERYRGRTCYSAAAQAAEHAIRSASGLRRIDDLTLVGVEGSTVRFRGRGGREHAARVEESQGPAVPASCGDPPAPQAIRVAHLL